jgi:hypothetical protein
MLYNRFDPTPSEIFYKQEEAELNEMNRRIESLENNPERKRRQQVMEAVKEQTTRTLTKARNKQKEQKKLRQQRRNETKDGLLSAQEYQMLLADLGQQSYADKRYVKRVKAQCQAEANQAEDALDELENEIQFLKQTRKTKSGKLQPSLCCQFSPGPHSCAHHPGREIVRHPSSFNTPFNRGIPQWRCQNSGGASHRRMRFESTTFTIQRAEASASPFFITCSRA